LPWRLSAGLETRRESVLPQLQILLDLKDFGIPDAIWLDVVIVHARIWRRLYWINMLHYFRQYVDQTRMRVCGRHYGNASFGHRQNALISYVFVIDLDGEFLVYLIIFEGVGKA
jgi:hypothetical protein